MEVAKKYIHSKRDRIRTKLKKDHFYPHPAWISDLATWEELLKDGKFKRELARNPNYVPKEGKRRLQDTLKATQARVSSIGSHRLGSGGFYSIKGNVVQEFQKDASNEDLEYAKRNGYQKLKQSMLDRGENVIVDDDIEEPQSLNAPLPATSDEEDEFSCSDDALNDNHSQNEYEQQHEHVSCVATTSLLQEEPVTVFDMQQEHVPNDACAALVDGQQGEGEAVFERQQEKQLSHVENFDGQQENPIALSTRQQEKSLSGSNGQKEKLVAGSNFGGQQEKHTTRFGWQQEEHVSHIMSSNGQLEHLSHASIYSGQQEKNIAGFVSQQEQLMCHRTLSNSSSKTISERQQEQLLLHGTCSKSKQDGGLQETFNYCKQFPKELYKSAHDIYEEKTVSFQKKQTWPEGRRKRTKASRILPKTSTKPFEDVTNLQQNQHAILGMKKDSDVKKKRAIHSLSQMNHIKTKKKKAAHSLSPMNQEETTKTRIAHSLSQINQEETTKMRVAHSLSQINQKETSYLGFKHAIMEVKAKKTKKRSINGLLGFFPKED